MASIRCGKCSGTHDSIAAVRQCYGVAARVTVVANAPEAHATIVRTAGAPSTEAQRTLIANLRRERGLDALSFTGTKDQASAEIKRLINLPKPEAQTTAATAATPKAEVPAGRYAIEIDGVLKFFRVDCPTEGRWAGRTFVKVQASDELHPVKGAAASYVLFAIAKDPREASLRYGREIGACGVCGRTLTDEASRAAGIGPICASKSGW